MISIRVRHDSAEARIKYKALQRLFNKPNNEQPKTMPIKIKLVVKAASVDDIPRKLAVNEAPIFLQK